MEYCTDKDNKTPSSSLSMCYAICMYFFWHHFNRSWLHISSNDKKMFCECVCVNKHIMNVSLALTPAGSKSHVCVQK